MTWAAGPLKHLLDESKESLIEAERAFLSKALALLQASPHQNVTWHLCAA